MIKEFKNWLSRFRIYGSERLLVREEQQNEKTWRRIVMFDNQHVFNVELAFDRQPVASLGVDLGENLMSGGDTRYAGVHLRLPFIGAVFFSLREAVAPEFSRGYEFNLSCHDGKFFITLLGDGDGSWLRDDPWWKKSICIDPMDILGDEERKTKKKDLGWVTVPMPEGTYQAKAERLTVTVTRSRWPWPVERWSRLSFEEFKNGPTGWADGKAIPFPGKGENSWDCGTDGTFGISFPTSVRDIPEAIGHTVADALRKRHRGARMDWTPPVEVKRAKGRRKDQTDGK